ncbi:MAG: GntR family transcriptional regulator, partial [Arenibacter algicola]|nr:GntR family transcriptional regulator [Arenibacter algicola]
MIKLGTWSRLIIDRDTSVGLFLTTDDKANDVLLPNKYVPEEFEIGDHLDVFCYLDHEERIVATTLVPFVTVDQFQLLQVAEVNEYGAFMDWGLEKHLLVPFREQRNKMQEGQWYVVYCYLDEKTDRLVASNKLDKFLSNDE